MLIENYKGAMARNFDEMYLETSTYDFLTKPYIISRAAIWEHQGQVLKNLKKANLIVKKIELSIQRGNFLVIEHALCHLKVVLHQVKPSTSLMACLDDIERYLCKYEITETLHEIRSFYRENRLVRLAIAKCSA